jgi:hypothetical protein
MSAVKYVCPIEGCGSKGFDEPGKKTKMTCRHHGERMVQHEAGAHIPTERYRKPVAVDDSGRVILAPAETVQDDPDALERTELNQRYQDATGTPADRRWGLARLRSNVEAEEARAAERKAALEAAQAEDEAEAAALAELTASDDDTQQEPQEEVTA